MQMQPQMQIMTVTVPAGVPVGGSFLIAMPDGQQMQVQAQVPEGQTMQIQVPAPAMAVAQPVQPMQPVAQPGAPVGFGGQQQQMPQFAPVAGFPPQIMTIQAPQVVQGIPLDPSMFVTSTLGLAVDPVPMLDAQTAGILASVNKFKVKQRLAIWEAITQGACEQQNVYDIYDDATGAPLFTAIEDSDGCTRCCCAPYHSYLLKFKPAAPGVSRHTIRSDGSPTLMTMEREGCCSKWGLGCFACTDDCKDGFVLPASPWMSPACRKKPSLQSSVHAKQPRPHFAGHPSRSIVISVGRESSVFFGTPTDAGLNLRLNEWCGAQKQRVQPLDSSTAVKSGWPIASS